MKLHFPSFLLLLLLLNINSQLTPQQLKLKQSIKGILDSHLVQGTKWGMPYHFYRPGLVKYGPYQWLWDSCFHMIAWSRINVTNSILDLHTMLQKQNSKTQKIPQMIFWGKQPLKDKILNKLLLSNPTVTDITQMPILPLALKRIYEQTQNKTLLEQFLIKVAEYHQWWANYRQPDHDGLIVIIHPWESGMDASPMYDEAFRIVNPKPAYKELYPKFLELQLSYRFLYRWKLSKILKPKSHKANKKFLNYFVIKQVGVNSIYTYGWKILSKLSQQLNNTNMKSYCQKQYNHFLKGLTSLYNKDLNRYTSKYLDGDQYRPTMRNTVQVLFPLIVDDIPEDHRAGILQMLRDEKYYHSDYPVPTVARSDPSYNPIFTTDLMWRGPSWAAPNYFILEALRNLNQKELYQQIAQKWKNQVMVHGIYQMWNPQSGENYGVKDLGMSTSVIDVIYRMKQFQKS